MNPAWRIARLRSPEGSGGGEGAERTDTSNPDAPPMTWSLLGRFFGVPLLIIGTIVGGAVFVVLLFGGPAAPDRVSIDDLLRSLEASSGAKSAGILLPREKELWQRAVELSERLRNKDKELTAEQLDSTANRLSAMINADLAARANAPAGSNDAARQSEIRSSRLEFLIRALGRTETRQAVETLIGIVEAGTEPYASAAMLQLGELPNAPGIAAAVPAMTRVLKNSQRKETQIVASTALSLLARPGDRDVIAALSELRLASEGEVGWSASLALARLGSDAGKSTLLDLLDRSFWESGERYETVDQTGTTRRYAMPESRIQEYLKAAIDAASKLSDAEIWTAIEILVNDRSALVKGAAREAIKKRDSSGSD